MLYSSKRTRTIEGALSTLCIAVAVATAGCGSEARTVVVDGNLSISFSVANAGPYRVVASGLLDAATFDDRAPLRRAVEGICSTDGAAPATPSRNAEDEFFEFQRGVFWDAVRLVVVTSTNSINPITGLLEPQVGDRIAVGEALTLDVCGPECRSGSFALSGLLFESFPGCGQ